jgi:hypothetical protein
MTAAPGSNSRIDTIIVRIQDSAYSGASNTATIESVTGTAAASPVAPSLPANSIALADVLIPSGDTQYTDSQITDRRSYCSVGIIPVRNSSDRPTPAYTGMTIMQLDNYTMYTYTGTAWEVPGSAAAWTTFPFAANYVDAAGLTGAPAAAYRVVGNRVDLRGSVRHTATSNLSGSAIVVGTLPVGARPTGTNLSFGVAQWGTANPPIARREIMANGNVSLQAIYTATWISLDGISFYTA